MSGMWNIHIIPFRDGKHRPEDGAQRWFVEDGCIPDMDHNIMHRGEMFVVDRVIWDKERSTVTLHVVPVTEDETDEIVTGESPDDEDTGDEIEESDESPDGEGKEGE